MEEDTGVTPPALQNAPTLEGELLGQYRIFLEVAKNRPHSAGGPLPITDGNLADYFQVNQVPRDQWAEIRDFVSRLDSIWLEDFFAAAEASKPTKQA